MIGFRRPCVCSTSTADLTNCYVGSGHRGVITASADKIDLVKAELGKLISITRAESGCINYDLQQDNENPAHFLFYENWESRELWQMHMGNRHLQDYMAATDGAVEEFTLFEMTKLDQLRRQGTEVPPEFAE